jgi:hypothetical protein
MATKDKLDLNLFTELIDLEHEGTGAYDFDWGGIGEKVSIRQIFNKPKKQKKRRQSAKAKLSPDRFEIISWRRLNFTERKEKTLPQLILSRPDYFYWGLGKGVFDDVFLKEQADVLEFRARHIKIPRQQRSEKLVDYCFDENDRFLKLEIVNARTPWNPCATFRLPHIDFSVLRRCNSHDMESGTCFIRSFKAAFFGNPSRRLDQANCEIFFNDQANFSFK